MYIRVNPCILAIIPHQRTSEQNRLKEIYIHRHLTNDEYFSKNQKKLSETMVKSSDELIFLNFLFDLGKDV